MELNYRKNKNEKLFSMMKNSELLNLENIQNYIPIYNNFFNLNKNNYNSINLNNHYSLNTIDEKYDYSKYRGHVLDNCNNTYEKHIFFKYSPLIDPIKYMMGKYESSYNILELPKISNIDTITDICNNKLVKKYYETNNSAYSDGFFSFLSSSLLNNYNFINGIDYYGSFLGIKKDFIFDIIDDIEYLDESEYFHKNNNVLFKLIQDKSGKYKNIFENTKKYRKKLIIDLSKNIDISIDDIVCTLNNDNSDNIIKCNLNFNEDVNTDLNNDLNTDLNTDLNEDLNLDKEKRKKNITNQYNSSESSCSSRYSNTESDNNSDNLNSSDEESDQSDCTSTSSESQDALYININKFPVQTIAMECCNDTLDSYIMMNKLSDKEWESIVLQILFTLITYQKIFDFTHNDLHTNNIVWITTEKKFLYYKYDNKHYKVPTFGKIYKIIDFGRAIYKYKGTLICSDSYAEDGDANTQYNCEPYLNINKPKIYPNLSFDLCRLGCSLFDYFIDDIDDIKKLKSPIKKIMVSWIYDDNAKNILYKNNGSERYPDFKLYKMIARTVHKHIPAKVLKNSLFENYLISKKKINAPNNIINIDTIPVMI